MSRTSFSLKRIALPFRFARMMSSLPEVSFAAMSWSPSRRITAMMPPRRGFAYAEMCVFLMKPSFVASMR